MDIQEEWNRQINNFVSKGYAENANMSREKFVSLFEPLKEIIATLPSFELDIKSGHISFVLVVKSTIVSTNAAVSMIEKDGHGGISKLFPLQPDDFITIETVSVPENNVYALVDIDRGKESINIPPKDAMTKIITAHRSPLTIDEGVAIVTQFPDFLVKNNCFSLLGSRHPGDQRVPAIWINSHKNPNLGWCWNGNPHTWLGSASCARRIGVK